MLFKIPLLSFLLFAVTYPLCFWLSSKDPIQNNFHRFHLGCPAVIGGLAVFGIWLLPFDTTLKNLSAIWIFSLFLLTAYFWQKQGVHLLMISLICLWGFKLYALVYSQWISTDTNQIIVSLLSGLIVSSIFYAMNLGHFYLNVLGLKTNHLKNATIAFALLLLLRFLWNIYYLVKGHVLYTGEQISLIHFMGTLDGFMLWVAIFFGTIFPLGASFFAFGTLKLKNTQATTGILYVLLSAVLLGDLAYKYYLLKFQIPL